MVLAQIAFVLSFSMTSTDDRQFALASCNSNSDPAHNCLEEFRNAARTMSGQDSDAERAQTAGEAIKNCWTCAGETLSDQIHNFNGSSTETSSDDQ